jgi:hypothetical protein
MDQDWLPSHLPPDRKCTPHRWQKGISKSPAVPSVHCGDPRASSWNGAPGFRFISVLLIAVNKRVDTEDWGRVDIKSSVSRCYFQSCADIMCSTIPTATWTSIAPCKKMSNNEKLAWISNTQIVVVVVAGALPYCLSYYCLYRCLSTRSPCATCACTICAQQSRELSSAANQKSLLLQATTWSVI